MKIVVVNQPQRGLETVYQALKGQAYDVAYIQEMRELFFYIEQREPFILLYDDSLISQAERILCEKMRIVNEIPTLILTNDTNVVESQLDQLVIRKPFYFPVLLRKLKNFIALNREGGVKPVDWELRSDCYELVIDGEVIPLCGKEVETLKVLTRTDEIVSREALALQLWGEVTDSTIRSTEYQIARVRKKITVYRGRFEIKTVYRNGYRLVVRN